MSHFSPTSPTVSVLMPACDCEKTVHRAVESVQNQILGNVELVAVDAGSKDGTGRYLDIASERDIRVVVRHEEKCPRGKALQIALEAARGTYVAVLDSDGWYGASALEKMVEAAEGSSLDLVVGDIAAEVAVGGRPAMLEARADEVVYETQNDFRTNAWRHFASGQLVPAAGKLFDRARALAAGCAFDVDAETDHSFTIDYLRGVERVGFCDAVYRVERKASWASGIAFAELLFEGLDREYGEMLDLLREWGLEGDAASMTTLQARYLEMLSLCVETASAPQRDAKGDEARALVGRMIGSDRAKLAASVAAPRDSAARALVGPIRTGNVTLAYAQSRLLALLRRGAPSVLAPDAFI